MDKLGDDPLTPEALDDLETLLIRADVGIDSTDKVISSLRTKLNEEVLGGEAGIKFLKKELKSIIDKPIQQSGSDVLVPKKGVKRLVISRSKWSWKNYHIRKISIFVIKK